MASAPFLGAWKSHLATYRIEQVEKISCHCRKFCWTAWPGCQDFPLAKEGWLGYVTKILVMVGDIHLQMNPWLRALGASRPPHGVSGSLP